MDFKQADEKFKQLKARFEAAELTEAEFKAQLQDLMVQDEQGNWWTIGYETERWYRHDGTSWVQADPPGSQEAIPVLPAGPQTMESSSTGNTLRGQGVRRAASGPAISIPAIPRRSLFSMVAIAALMILSIGGYYLLRDTGGEALPPAPAQQKPVTITPRPTTRASQTPRPATPSSTTRSSQTSGPTSTSEPEWRVYVSAKQVTLYQGPSLKYGLAAQNPYLKGAVFTGIARNPAGDWLLCEAPDGIRGWLYIVWVDADFDPLLVPTAATLPPPPPTPTRRPNGGPGCTGFGC